LLRFGEVLSTSPRSQHGAAQQDRFAELHVGSPLLPIVFDDLGVIFDADYNKPWNLLDRETEPPTNETFPVFSGAGSWRGGQPLTSSTPTIGGHPRFAQFAKSSGACRRGAITGLSAARVYAPTGAPDHCEALHYRRMSSLLPFDRAQGGLSGSRLYS
jgi:hypothetical protein